MKKLTYYSIILLVLIPLTNIQAQTEPWFDGKYCKSYKLLWQDAITETHLSKPFTMETFNEFGWCLKTNGFRTEKPDNNKFGGFSRAPDGKPAVLVLYPAMSFWENGGISIETKHFPSKEQSIDTILYAYDVMLEVDPTQYPFLSAPEVTENTSISGKLFGLTSNNFSSGNFTPSQQTGFVIREVWRGNKSKGA